MNAPGKSIKKVLIVEDDKFIRTLVQNRLSDLHYEVDAVGDGISALDYLQKNKPDIIFLDVIVPGLSGFEILHTIRSQPELKARFKDTPVAIVSNLAQDSDIKTGYDLGANAYFVKKNALPEAFIEQIIEYMKNPVSLSPKK